MEGVITKGIGGFYYVETADGVLECKPRGVFRKEGVVPLVGDYVNVSGKAAGAFVIDEIRERKNRLIRPAVSNVSQLCLVAATRDPAPNYFMLDKLIASCEAAEIGVVLCVNKIDLGGNVELVETYRKAGFEVLEISAEKETNLGAAREVFKGQTTVCAGNSGVGKSTLLNAILGEAAMETGETSRIQRGRHTTRHAELLKLDFGGYVIDTPGFSSLEITDVKVDDLPDLFREFRKYTGECRHSDCGHTVEQGCEVLAAVEAGEIPRSRHESYVKLYEELKKVKDWEK